MPRPRAKSGSDASSATKRERLRLLQEQERRQCEDSLLFFVKRAWRILNPDADISVPTYLEMVCEHLEAVALGKTTRLILNVPPRTAKSTIVSVCFPVWLWLRQPGRRAIFVSHAVDLANRASRARSSLINSSWFQRHWSDHFQLTLDNATEVRNDKQGHFLASTTTGATGKGGNCLIIDDPHSVADAWSDALREKDNEQIRSTLMSRLDDPKTDAIVLIMQRLHTADATGMLQELGGWTTVSLAAEIETPEDQEHHVFPLSGRVWTREAGDLLDGSRLSKTELQKLEKSLGRMHYSGQYLQRPYIPGGNIFRRDWWQRYDAWDESSLEPKFTAPLEFEQIVLSVDASFKSGKENDYVALQVWGFAGPRSYLCDRRTQRLGYVATKQAIRDTIEKWARLGRPISAVIIEDKANGPAIIEELKNEFSIIAINPGADSKVSRAMAVTPQVEAHDVYIPSGSAYDDLIDTLAKFPKARHDDDADALTQALNWRNRRTHGLLTLWDKKIAQAASPQPQPGTQLIVDHDHNPTADEVRERARRRRQETTRQMWPIKKSSMPRSA